MTIANQVRIASVLSALVEIRAQKEAEFEAGALAGYKEFFKGGVAYRATDSVGEGGKRIPVAVRKNEPVEQKTGNKAAEEFLSGNVKPLADAANEKVVKFFDLEVDFPGIKEAGAKALNKSLRDASDAFRKSMSASDLADPVLKKLQEQAGSRKPLKQAVTLTGVTRIAEDTALMLTAMALATTTA